MVVLVVLSVGARGGVNPPSYGIIVVSHRPTSCFIFTFHKVVLIDACFRRIFQNRSRNDAARARGRIATGGQIQPLSTVVGRRDVVLAHTEFGTRRLADSILTRLLGSTLPTLTAATEA